MLIVFRKLLPGMGTASTLVSAQSVGTLGVELEGILDLGRVDRAEDDTARLDIAVGSMDAEEPLLDSEVWELIELFRDLAIGRAGRGVFGGPKEGRDGLGNVVAIISPSAPSAPSAAS